MLSLVSCASHRRADAGRVKFQRFYQLLGKPAVAEDLIHRVALLKYERAKSVSRDAKSVSVEAAKCMENDTRSTELFEISSTDLFV